MVAVFEMDWTNPRKIALFLDLFVVFILHVRIHALDHAVLCPVFKVQRGTVHKVFINKSLKISCNLKYCDDQIIDVRWSKYTLTDWIPVSESNQTTSSQSRPASNLLTSYLTFTNISKYHEGLYRCELWLSNSSTVSHYINVFVSDDSMGEEKLVNESSNTDSRSWWWPYLLISLGLVILVLTVMFFSIMCIYGYKSSGKKNKRRAQAQYTGSLLTRLSPDVQKRGEFVCIQYSEDSLPHTSDCGGDYHLSNRKGSTSSQVVYASLHHLTPTASSTTHCQTSDECSEYAAIRIS